MGIPFSLFGSYGNVKRRHEEESNDEEILKSPVRKKLKTADYIYQELFINGEKSDVTICALGKEWRLHKVYLSQSHYFCSMFNGAWKESKQEKISLIIPNKLITIKSLNQIFGSLYRDEIEIDPSDVASLLATAVLLQLDNVVAQCAEVMTENINIKTVLKYYFAAQQNGLLDIQELCTLWIKRNLLVFANNSLFLKGISTKLMKTLISSPDLIVIQGEIDIYSLLKKWIFVRLNRYSKSSEGALKAASDNYFLPWKCCKRSFLESVRGRKFFPIFSRIHLCHVLHSDKNVQLLLQDNLIPKEVIERTMSLQWQMQLSMENDPPVEDKTTLTEDEFHVRAIRCGRVLPQDIPHCWRWSGFYFGVDILLSYKNRVLIVKRNCTSQTCPYSVNMKSERTIFYKLTVLNFDKHRRILWCQSTGLENISLKLDDSCVVLRIPNNVSFPLTVAFWYSVIPLDSRTSDIVKQYKDVWNGPNLGDVRPFNVLLNSSGDNDNDVDIA